MLVSITNKYRAIGVSNIYYVILKEKVAIIIICNTYLSW